MRHSKWKFTPTLMSKFNNDCQPTLFELEKHTNPTTPICLTDNTEAAMLKMLSTGLDKEFAALLLELAKYKLAHVRYLAGPIIVHQSRWENTIPKWLTKAIPAARAEAIFTEAKDGEMGELATDEEVLAYMYPATMAAPLSNHWYQVYMYTGNLVLTKHQKLPQSQTFWEYIGIDRPITYDEVKDDYEELARDIRKKVVKAAAGRGVNATKLVGQSNAKTNEASKIPTQAVQLSIFPTDAPCPEFE